MNSSIYSSIGRKASDTQKQNSISIDFQSVSSSCVTNKELKSINHFCSSINNYYKNMKKNNSIALNIFHLNNLKYNIQENKKLKHNFLKTKSCDAILPNISDNISPHPKKNIKNLKISINNDYSDYNLNNKNKNKNIFYTLNKSNFSTNANSLNLQNKSNISNIKKSLNNDYSTYINSNNNNNIRIKNSLSLSNLSINEDYYDNNDYKSKFKRESLYNFLDKTRKIIKYKFAQNDMKKLYKLEKEKIETNIEQYNLDINSLNKVKNLFQKYSESYDTYFLHINEEIIIGKKENRELVERKKVLNNEIFALGHTVYKIKNKLKDYLNNKYFLLSVKNHTKKLDFFSAKDKKDFNNDLVLLQQLDEKLNAIILVEPKLDKNEKDKKFDNPNEMKKYSYSKKDGFKKFIDVRKRFYSQKSIGESMRVKNIYNTPYMFIKDLNLISLGINKSLKIFNKIQLELLEDKKLLNNLNKSSFENEILEKEFSDKEISLKNKLNSSIIYYKYLKNQIKSLWFQSKKNKTRKDIILIKIEHILNNIKTFGSEKLLKFLENSENIEIIQNNDYNINNSISKKKNHKLNLLKIIEKIIIFLQNNNNEYKKNRKEKYFEIEHKIKYLSHLNNSRKIIENERNKRKIELIKILEKRNNFVFLSNKNNYYVNSKVDKNKFIDKNNNKENERKELKSLLDIDFDY